MEYLLVSRVDEESALSFTRELKKVLSASGHAALFEKETAAALGLPGGIPIQSAQPDLAVIIGGDGTMLRTVQKMDLQVPIIGINWGEVGFLAELEPSESQAFLSGLARGFPVERRMRISLTVENEHVGDALNEALVVTSRPAKMLRFMVIVDGVPADRFRADGLLMSTPTGSTAYAMSAGGPIVDPRIEGVLLIPLAPYMLSSRPHLISSERSLKIHMDSSKPANLVIDGQKTVELGSESTITVKKSLQPALFIDAGKNFFEKVDSKLRRL